MWFGFLRDRPRPRGVFRGSAAGAAALRPRAAERRARRARDDRRPPRLLPGLRGTRNGLESGMEGAREGDHAPDAGSKTPVARPEVLGGTGAVNGSRSTVNASSLLTLSSREELLL